MRFRKRRSWAFDDPFAIEYQDDQVRLSRGSGRQAGYGTEHGLLAVVYTVRDEHVRIISAREAKPQ